MASRSDTYQRILESARDLIYASSYADVGVAAICERANVKKGSFYHFFTSKQELTISVLDTYFVDMKEQILDHAFNAGLKPMERLNKFYTMVIDMQSSIFEQTGHVLGCPFGNLALELATRDEPIRKKVDQVFTRLQTLIKVTLDEAMASGDLEQIDTGATARALIAYFEGAVLLAKAHNDPSILKQLLPAAAQIRILPSNQIN